MPSFPFSCFFAPSDEQLVKHYLWKAINGEPTGLWTIPKADVYGCDPCTLDWADKEMKKMLQDNELYFLVERFKISDKPGVKQPRRSLKQSDDDAGGFWKSNTGNKFILDQTTGRSIGTKKTLTFFRGKKGQCCQKTDYIMHEYLLPQGLGHIHDDDHFQKIALCRIKFNGKNSSTVPPFGGNVPIGGGGGGLELDEEESAFASSLEDYLQLQPDQQDQYSVHDDHDHRPALLDGGAVVSTAADQQQQQPHHYFDPNLDWFLH